MSQTYSLICHETKSKVWIGQGWGKMTTLYSGNKEIMIALKTFLQDHIDKNLVFICNDKNDDIWNYKEY